MRIIPIVFLALLLAVPIYNVQTEPDFILLVSLSRDGVLKVYPNGTVERIDAHRATGSGKLEVLGDCFYLSGLKIVPSKTSRADEHIHFRIDKYLVRSGRKVGTFDFLAYRIGFDTHVCLSSFVWLPGGRIAVLDGCQDMIHIYKQEGALVKKIKMLSEPDSDYQEVDGVVVNNSLIVSSDGYGRIFKIDLATYDIDVILDLPGDPDLTSIDYAGGYYYVSDDKRVYRFKEGDESLTLLAEIPTEEWITSIAVVDGYLYASTKKRGLPQKQPEGGQIFRVNVITGQVEHFAKDLGYIEDMEVYFPHGPLPVPEVPEKVVTPKPTESTTRPETRTSTTQTSVEGFHPPAEPEPTQEEGLPDNTYLPLLSALGAVVAVVILVLVARRVLRSKEADRGCPESRADGSG